MVDKRDCGCIWDDTPDVMTVSFCPAHKTKMYLFTWFHKSGYHEECCDFPQLEHYMQQHKVELDKVREHAVQLNDDYAIRLCDLYASVAKSGKAADSYSEDCVGSNPTGGT